MKTRLMHLFAALLVVLLVASCVNQRRTPGVITEAKALELAKQEFSATGRNANAYRLTIESDSSGQRWLIWFDQKGAYASPGGRHAVIVDKTTGKTTLLPGE